MQIRKAKMTDLGHVEGTYDRLIKQLKEAFEQECSGQDPAKFKIKEISFEKK